MVRPWQVHDPAQLLRVGVRWTVLESGRLAVLDRRFTALLSRFPEVNAMLIDRLTERAQRLAITQAISQLNGVDRRILALFWYLAERWGRVVPRGVAVTMPVPHRLIAQLVGARRPTVSTALGQLAERGELVRIEDQSWLLTGEPVGVPVGEAARVIRGRRRRVVADGRSGRPTRPRRLDPASGCSSSTMSSTGCATAAVCSARRYAALREESAAIMDRLAAGRARRGRTFIRRDRGAKL